VHRVGHHRFERPSEIAAVWQAHDVCWCTSAISLAQKKRWREQKGKAKS